MKMNSDYTIRLETENDHREVENLTREAFWDVYKPGCDEHYYAHMMRSHADFIPELDFVLEKDGRIAANIMYYKTKLIDENGTVKDIVSFGPISVLPEYQRQGYGKALIMHSFEKALALGYDTVVIYGNPGNYVSRGFVSCRKKNVCLEGDIYPTAMLVIELREGALDGRKWYYYESDAPQCCADTEAVAAFDAGFPPKVKHVRPSQEEFYIYSHSAIVR